MKKPDPKKRAQQFVNDHDGKPVTVHLTNEQVEILQGLAPKFGVEFKDLVMLLMQLQLKHMDDIYGALLTNEQAKRN